ncbi:MAG: TetR/AcrR family transcriptional regulator [Saprospiraceae bacterium]|nr:TetR/AcrR family transcriptional regulator [Saprospiraceae bacterium]
MIEFSAQERIKLAAAKIFTHRGLEGARMQDIADEAKINKAMLHYYFKNKQHLFELIFQEKLYKVFGALNSLFSDEFSFEDRLRHFVAKEIDIISEFPALPLFILLEARKNPGILQENFKNFPLKEIRIKFSEVIKNESDKGNIIPIKMEELLMNIMSLCVYPIVAEPMFRFVFDMDEVAYKKLIKLRKITVSDMIINSLKIK